jgi:hypothetical protein
MNYAASNSRITYKSHSFGPAELRHCAGRGKKLKFVRTETGSHVR